MHLHSYHIFCKGTATVKLKDEDDDEAEARK